MGKQALIAGVALVALSLSGPAAAQDVRPPDNATVGGMSSGTIKLPSTSKLSSGRTIRTTMQEKRRVDVDPVDKDTVQALREMAKESGQTSNSNDKN